MIKARIIQFRRSRHRIKERQFLIEVPAKNKEEASKMIGKEVIWVSKGKSKKQIKGKISSSHGNKGLVRAIFEKGLPGQAVLNNDSVEIK